jgi:hypothetical protein
MKRLRVLVGCEYSGTVRNAFLDRGHDAWSCDLLDTEQPGPHITGDVFEILNEGWDLAIFHPSCTYLTIAAEWAYGPGPYHQKVKPETLVGEARVQARKEAIAFVKKLWAAPIDKIAIENPIGVLSREENLRKPSQIIQPHQFGHDASKATCLWLKSLPPLIPTDRVAPRLVQDKNGKLRERWANQTDSGQNKLTPSADRWKDRARTYVGIARSMAEQWS